MGLTVFRDYQNTRHNSIVTFQYVQNIKNPRDSNVRYLVTTEVRNNIVAAMANIRSCSRYLESIKFPYCKECEIQTLEKACENVYIGNYMHNALNEHGVIVALG